jgi:Peptidase family M28
VRRREFCTNGLLASGLAGLALVGCRDDPAGRPPAPRAGRTPQSTPTPTDSPSDSPVQSPTPTPTPTPAGPGRFDADAALAVVGHLAGTIGPREATSTAYRRAARYIEAKLRASGYQVARQQFRVPAGNSWGVAVRAGRSANLVAALPGFDPRAPHLVVGAHLDTVPQAPGAEDNASGVAVLVDVARLHALAAARGSAGIGSRLPVVFVAFGAEEPRGEGDALHHFGSRHYVGELTSRERRAVRGMVSLDRVGVGAQVRIRTGGRAPDTVADELETLAGRRDIPVSRGTNQASDHWSFEKAGIAAARLGGNPYAAYHSAADRPSVVTRSALDRTGRLLRAWLVDG